MKLSPMLQVDDVEAASRWYQAVLGLVSGHGGPDYEMLFAGEPYATPMLLHLHRWDAQEHGFMGSREVPRGNGTSLWFEVGDRAALDAVWARVGEQGVEILEAPHWNPLAHHHELTVRDRDGYVVVVHTPFDPSSLGAAP
jgi:catechol 2,3-dioxygenase-like lactoylglutathione lyase family enzyme